MNKKHLTLAALLLASSGLASAQTILIGPSVRNGDFNDDTDPTDVRTSDDTPFWEGVGGLINIQQATRTNLPNASGSRNTQVSHQANVILGQSTEHVIALNDSFSVSYEWRDAFNWDDAVDKIRIELFVTDTDAIDGFKTVIGSTDSPISSLNGTYELVEANDFYIADETHVGKTVFVGINSFNDDNNGFARLDDFELTVGTLDTDPLLRVTEGDYLFGDLVHPTAAAGTSKSVLFKNLGATMSLTLDSISLTNDGGGIFVIEDTPADGTVIAAGETFEVEVAAIGGANFNTYTGEISIQTTPADQSLTLPLSATISTGNEVYETGSVLLVDFDDGIANGIHEASLRNGGFEEGTDGQNFVDTPSWVSAFSPEGDSVIATLSTSPATGLFHSQTGGFLADLPEDERAQVMQVIPMSDWTLEAGDYFEIGFSAKAGTNFAGQPLQIIVEVIDANGFLISDPVNGQGGVASRLASLPGVITGDGSTYEALAVTTIAVPRNSPWIGNGVQIRILTQGSRTSFAEIDDVSITGQFNRLQTGPSGDVEVTDLSVDSENSLVTIRFTDSGASSYAIESDADLDFSEGSSITQLNGGGDRDSFPGQIQFTFVDGNAAESSSFYRVISN
ncbi:hypothetical protein N9916_00010 [Akkermansiaceae bacterium]|nr:hypothetical protein [Akkermansiaceae bacterium]MDB4318725.1 hypothetical protein [Akkermansiaceae bacterium]